MVNGTVAAPFVHDSNWPEKSVRLFRNAVYYLHVHVPGRGPVVFLRKLAECEKGPKWKCLRVVCNKLVHLQLEEQIKDEEMAALARNLLCFANGFLVERYGIQNRTSLHFDMGSEAKNKEHRELSEEARREFKKKIEESFKGLETAYRAMDPNRLKQEVLTLKGQQVLSEISKTLHVVDAKEVSGIVIKQSEPKKGVCAYEFRDHDPAGWDVVSGDTTEDRFSHNETARNGRYMRELVN